MQQSKLSPRAAFNHVITLINAGDLGNAAEFCREAVKSNPSDINMTALLGAILLKSRDFEGAEAILHRAIELAPNFAKPHEDLGILLVETGRAEEAVPVLKNATRLDPQAEMAFFTLGRALAMTGKGADADAAFEASFELNPERKQMAMAAEHHKEGRQSEAARLYRQVLRKFPGNVDAMRLLAAILASQSETEESEVLLRKAISLAPDYTLAHTDLAAMMHEQHRYAEAIELLEHAIMLEPGNVKANFLLASTLAPSGRTFDALDAYRKVIELRPDHAGAWLGLGHTLKTVGHQQEAIDAYRECLRIRPDNGEVYWSLANLKTYPLSGEDMAAMTAALEQEEGLTDQSAVHFLFALGKAAEDAGDFDAAWTYYKDGNVRQRALEHYDPVQTEVTNDEIIQVFNRELLEQKQGQGNPDPSPIFIVGLPRSGSTLIEQILASHSHVEGTSELPYVGRAATSLNRNRADGINYPFAVRELQHGHLQQLGTNYLERAQAHRHSDQPRFIDKMPNNFPSIGLIHLMLPNAKIIDARRYPLDSTLSCFRQLFARGQTFVYDLYDIGEYFLEYQRMMDHWHEVLPGRVLTVQYEDLVTDFEPQVRRLLEYCELPFEDSCLKFYKNERPVRTASSEQVRQPVYTNSIHRWRNYEAHLDELIEILEPVLPRYARYEAINT
jgi:tetratricopeptide (TPR) repeat protein